jgi:hypothetical protein
MKQKSYWLCQVLTFEHIFSIICVKKWEVL